MAVYFVRDGGLGYVKIGWAKSVASRVRSLQTSHANRLVILREIDDVDRTLESRLHHRFREQRVRGEWFEFSPEMLTINAGELPLIGASLEVARNLQAKKAVNFSSAIRLSNGEQQFTYAETIDGSSAKGTIKVPEEFTLGIPVFLGGVLYEVRARLRYRIHEGQLQLWYELYRPEHIEQDAFNEICVTVGKDTKIAVWLGAP